MTQLTTEQTLRHIHHKVAMRELAPDLGERMITLLEADPTLDYRQLQLTALRRELPETVFHASSLRNRLSIAARGLLAADPALRRDASFHMLGQPIGVYVSAEPDEIGTWVAKDPSWGIWSITGAQSLPHRQDPLNPEHFVIECNVPRQMIRFHGTVSLGIGLQLRR